MNKKQIESRIKMEANQIEVPDLKQQILAQVPNRKVIEKEEKKRFNLSLHFSYILSLVVVVIVAVLIFNQGGNSTTPNVLTKQVGSIEKAYAKQVVTLAGFADDVKTTPVSYTGLINYDLVNYDDIASKINEYFKAVSLLLNEESTTYEIELGNYYVKNLANGQTVMSGSKQNFTWYTNNTIELFTSTDYGRIYYLKIYDNNILIRNFVPCYRKSDGVIGLYDKANNNLAIYFHVI